MIIDLQEQQLLKFEQVAQQLMAAPERYLNFDSVADFYQAPWLDAFPKGTTYFASGLDDGAEHFDARIEFRVYRQAGHTTDVRPCYGRYLMISSTETVEVKLGIIVAQSMP